LFSSACRDIEFVLYFASRLSQRRRPADFRPQGESRQAFATDSPKETGVPHTSTKKK
jgi:hypothetical protein